MPVEIYLDSANHAAQKAKPGPKLAESNARAQAWKIEAQQQAPLQLQNNETSQVQKAFQEKNNTQYLVQYVNACNHVISADDVRNCNNFLTGTVLGHGAEVILTDLIASVEKLESIKKVNDLLRDRNTRSTTAFEKAGEKSMGLSSGEIVREHASSRTFMVKKSCKKKSDYPDGTENKIILNERMDNLREFVSADLFGLLLHDRVPKISLVLSDADPKLLSIRSKMLSGCINFKKFCEEYGVSNYKISGFEKVIAACQILGDGDYHADNLMLRGLVGLSNRVEVFKVDHGKSMMIFPRNFNEFVLHMNDHIKGFGYLGLIEKGSMKFSVHEYVNSLRLMLGTLDDSILNSIVDSKMAELGNAGLSITDLPFFLFRVPGEISAIEVDIDHLRAEAARCGTTVDEEYLFWIAHTVKRLLKNNLIVMKQVLENIKVIAELNTVDSDFKDGKWLVELLSQPDPEAYIHALKEKELKAFADMPALIDMPSVPEPQEAQTDPHMLFSQVKQITQAETDFNQLQKAYFENRSYAQVLDRNIKESAASHKYEYIVYDLKEKKEHEFRVMASLVCAKDFIGKMERLVQQAEKSLNAALKQEGTMPSVFTFCAGVSLRYHRFKLREWSKILKSADPKDLEIRYSFSNNAFINSVLSVLYDVVRIMSDAVVKLKLPSEPVKRLEPMKI